MTRMVRFWCVPLALQGIPGDWVYLNPDWIQRLQPDEVTVELPAKKQTVTRIIMHSGESLWVDALPDSAATDIFEAMRRPL